ncbi:unnamed protein product [Lota lota]
MMESCFNTRREVMEPMGVDDLKKDLCIEFSALPDSLQEGVVEVKKHLEVYLRIRPFTTAESHSAESQDCVNMESPETVLLKPPRTSSRLSDKSVPSTIQRFHFSKVYGPETSQLDLFEGTVKDLVRHVLEGGNSLVFTYGVTNAGKTFTFLGPDGDAGLLPRSLQLVFHSVEERVSPHMAVKPQRCREFSRLTQEQQAEEALAKRNLLRQLKESEKASASQLCSTSQNSSEGPSVLGSLLDDPIGLDLAPDTSFSIWVSFCEIYNENIHDLLEPGPQGAPRRAALRLSQDIKGNSFVKDLRWVQVNSAEEALKVMKLGRRNQSFSFTKLNQSSSRSHCIFSIRILRLDQAGVHSISESVPHIKSLLLINMLSLCDLAGSERCAKTQNRGERLKEAGNINTSLLTLGKCINALRHNQQAKLQQHVPFRESKLTHYLQSFFCGRGRACMIVNVNQCASMYDETLNVLKFAAVAQKVVVLTSKTLPIKPQRSAREVSFLINNADQKTLDHRRSSLIGWEHSLEDVQEEEDDDDDDDEQEESLMEDTMQEDSIEEDDEEEDKVVVCKNTYQRQVAQLKELQAWREGQQEQNSLLEERIREEVSSEFSALFTEMEAHYKERVEREKEIVEERAEKRLEIFKNLVKDLSSTGSGPEEQDMPVQLDVVIGSMSVDLAGIMQDAQATLSCLGEQSPDQLEVKVLSLEQQLNKSQELLDAKTTGKTRTLESHEVRMSQLMEMCQEKDDIISRLQKILDQERQDASDNEALAELLGERSTREAVYTPLEEQTIGKQEALVSLEEEGRGREEALASLEVERRGREEALASLEKERRGREEVLASLEEERRGREEALASLEKERRGKEEALASLEEERRCREEALASLEEDRRGREEALASLEKERRGREEALASLEEERRGREEALASLEEDRRGREEALASLEKERRGREEALASLEEERRCREEALASLEKERRGREEALASLEKERRGKEEALASLEEERRGREEALASLEEDRRGREEALASLEKERRGREEALASLEEERRCREEAQKSKEEHEEHKKQIQERELHIHRLELEVLGLKKEILGLKINLWRQGEEEKKKRMRQLEDLEQETSLAKERLVQSQREQQAKRRELLAVAEQAITEKDAELERRGLELQRLKQQSNLDSDRVKSLGVDLQRRDEETADLREKLADSKRQIQQVHKEVKALTQKLTDAEKFEKQLQSELLTRDRSILLLTKDQSQQTTQLYHQACRDLESQQRVMGGMRVALSEQEETQQQQEQLIQDLTHELDHLKGLSENHGNTKDTPTQRLQSELQQARQEVIQAQESLKLCAERQQADRRRWLEEKMLLIGQAKEAEEKRNQEMRKFAEDRERHAREHIQLESVCAELEVKEQAMEEWRRERDSLVSALEVQLQKLLSSNKDQEQLIEQLRSDTGPPLETEVEGRTPLVSTSRSSAERTSLGSAGFPSVLESSQISTENGQRSRFPRPELEISFSPLQPNRLALRRQGEQDSVTVKISHSSRKRRSNDMERSNTRSRKEGALQKIGGFLQSSPTLFTSRAKKVMSLVSSPSSSSSVRMKKSKKRLYQPHISSPMDLPSHTIITEEKDSDHLIIKRRLRTRTAK